MAPPPGPGQTIQLSNGLSWSAYQAMDRGWKMVLVDVERPARASSFRINRDGIVLGTKALSGVPAIDRETIVAMLRA